MQQAIPRTVGGRVLDGLVPVLPLYAASLIVTLAGVGAVGVTLPSPGWAPFWIGAVFAGHAASLLMRALGVPPEAVFYPVMGFGSIVVLRLAVSGSPLLGLEPGMGPLPPDIGTAVVVMALACVRCFTLVTDSALLFSPIPAITMLALTGSTNPNAEVPLFFGLMLLGALFSLGYERDLRRARQARRPPAPVVYHLLGAWGMTLVVGATALLAAVLAQAVLGPLSPFALPAMNRVRSLINFTNVTNSQAPVGRGPIFLSAEPVFEVYAPQGGLLRTMVFNEYTGRGWVRERTPTVAEIVSTERVPIDLSGIPSAGPAFQRFGYRFAFDSEPVPEGVRVWRVRQRFVVRGYTAESIPGMGRIVGLRYPLPIVYLHVSGCVTGAGHQPPGRVFEVVSEVRDYSEAALARAPAVDPEAFDEPEALELPASARPLLQLAREITRGIESPYERVRAILAYIERNCRYTLYQEPTPPGEDAAVFYLFQTRQGACDLAATAAALLCRAAGVPARVAVGFVVEEPLPGGHGFMVRQEHAHMWLEAYLPGFGWVPFNPAPPVAGLRNHPLELARYLLSSALRRIGGGGLDAVLFLAVLGATLWLVGTVAWSRLRRTLEARRRLQEALRGPAAEAILAYHRALRALARKGWRREPWMTPREYLEWLRAQWPGGSGALAPLEALTWRFEEARYAGAPAAPDSAALRALVAAVARQAPCRKRRNRKRWGDAG